MKKGILILILSIMSFGLLAQVSNTELSTSQFFDFLMASLGGIKGASTLAIVGIVLKLLLAFANTKDLFGFVFKNLDGAMKLTIVMGLSLVSGVISLMTVSGMNIGTALMHSTTMGAFLVFTNQIYKQFIEKKV